MTGPSPDTPAATDAPVLLDVAEGVATITLNRPAAYNSLDVATKELLRDTVRAVAADDACPAARGPAVPGVRRPRR